MIPARTAQRHYENTKLLVVKSCGNKVAHSSVRDLDYFFESGDILVVNSSGTMPSSFQGTIQRSQEPIELRLGTFMGANVQDFRYWKAISFGSGTWRLPTEQRGKAPHLQAGDIIHISADLSVRILKVDSQHSRLSEIEFISENLLQSLYQAGHPIQYSYLQEDLKVWDQQSFLSGAPISVEPPSSAFPLNWQTYFKLQKKGVRIVSLLHSAGLSSTGDAELDKAFPLDEFYEIPSASIDMIQQAKKSGKKVFALGTTVTRALESAFRNPLEIIPRGRTNLRLGRTTSLQITDVLLTGMHEPETNHTGLMEAFCPGTQKLLASIEQESTDYRSHEYGDLTLLFR